MKIDYLDCVTKVSCSADSNDHRLFLELEVAPKPYNYDALFIGINPSKADEEYSDKTINLLSERSFEEGWGKIVFYNLLSNYSTTFDQLSGNDHHNTVDMKEFESKVNDSRRIIVFWGNDAEKINSETITAFYEILKHHTNKLYCYGETKKYYPMHVSRKHSNFHLGPLYKVNKLSPILEVELLG